MSGEIHLFKLTISLPHVGNREDGFDLSRNELRRRDACLITDSRRGGRTDLDVEEDEKQDGALAEVPTWATPTEI